MISLTSPVETRAHGWPAGAKLAALAVSTMALAKAQGLGFHLGAFAFCLVLYALPGRVFFRAGLTRLKALWPFVVLLLAWHVLTGDPGAGAVITLRMLTAVGLANLVTMTTRLSDMMAVVRWMLSPFERVGLNLRAIDISVGLVIRMIPVLADKGSQLSESWRARSPHRPRHHIVFPLAVVALDDADRMGEALRARGGLTPPPKED